MSYDDLKAALRYARRRLTELEDANFDGRNDAFIEAMREDILALEKQVHAYQRAAFERWRTERRIRLAA